MVGAPNERWATELANVQTINACKPTLALVVDCYAWDLVGWHLSFSARTSTPVTAPEQALIAGFGKPGSVDKPLQMRSDNGAVFKSRRFRVPARRHGLGQEFIMPCCPQQNGKVGRLTRALKGSNICIVSALKAWPAQSGSQVIGFSAAIIDDPVRPLAL